MYFHSYDADKGQDCDRRVVASELCMQCKCKCNRAPSIVNVQRNLTAPINLVLTQSIGKHVLWLVIPKLVSHVMTIVVEACTCALNQHLICVNAQCLCNSFC